MALETATYIDGLNVANPVNSDSLSQGDDHLRLVKTTIKNTLPNITAAITKTAAQINNLIETTASLTALAALTPAADKLAYFTSGTVAALASLTTYGRSLIGAADAAATRTLLALGALATKATVATADIDNDSVTYAKFQNINTAKLLGRTTAAGDVEELVVGSKLSLTAGTLDAPGATVLQTVFVPLTTTDSTPSLIPADNTVPTNAEGKQAFSQSFTPKSAASTIIIEAVVLLSHGATGTDLAISLFKDAGVSAIAVASQGALASVMNTLVLSYSEASGSVVARTYALRYGAGASTAYLNRVVAGSQYGGVMISSLKITEVL